MKVSATGVNFADIATRRGGYPGSAAPPFIPGLDVPGDDSSYRRGRKRFEDWPARFGLSRTRFLYAEIAVARAILTVPGRTGGSR